MTRENDVDRYFILFVVIVGATLGFTYERTLDNERKLNVVYKSLGSNEEKVDLILDKLNSIQLKLENLAKERGSK